MNKPEYALELIDKLLDFYKKNYTPWIPVKDRLPDTGDAYEVTAVIALGSKVTYRELAFYNPDSKEWRDHFKHEIVHVVAWRDFQDLYELPEDD